MDVKSSSTILKVGSVSKGHPLKNWNEAVRNDKKAWDMEDLELNDKLIWRKGTQSAIQLSNPQRVEKVTLNG